jgi:hypothetical protein
LQNWRLMRHLSDGTGLALSLSFELTPFPGIFDHAAFV